MVSGRERVGFSFAMSPRVLLRRLMLRLVLSLKGSLVSWVEASMQSVQYIVQCGTVLSRRGLQTRHNCPTLATSTSTSTSTHQDTANKSVQKLSQTLSWYLTSSLCRCIIISANNHTGKPTRTPAEPPAVPHHHQRCKSARLPPSN